MSRYQTRVFLNNPEKKVPETIVDQFFLTTKTGDINQIRDFTINNKNKLNIVDKSGKTPFHAILELDEKVADNTTKLRALEYLAQSGAPMDLPDSQNIWPIHLAVLTQSKKIIDLLIKKNVNLNRKDSSNNTPLHYSVMGKEIPCPKEAVIGQLIPKQKSEKSEFNEKLKETSVRLSSILSTNQAGTNADLIHIINTIMKIPQMYEEDAFSRTLKNNIINIFTDIAISPAYRGEPNVQQQKLDDLVNQTYVTINSTLFEGVTRPLSIAPSSGGWGPMRISIPGAGAAVVPIRVPPTDAERIMATDRASTLVTLDTNYATLKRTVTTVDVNVADKVIRTVLPAIIKVIDDQYINVLLFCPGCPTSKYGEDVTLTKMLYLLTWNYYRLLAEDYPKLLSAKIVNNFSLMRKSMHEQIAQSGAIFDIRYEEGFLLQLPGTFTNLINDKTTFGEKSHFDDNFLKSIENGDPNTINEKNYCIQDNLIKFFSLTQERRLFRNNRVVNEYIKDDVILFKTRLRGASPILRTVASYYAPTSFIKVDNIRTTVLLGNLTWYEQLKQLIGDVRPQPRAGYTNIFIRPGLAAIPMYIVPDAHLPSPTRVPPRNVFDSGERGEITLYELIRIVHLIYQFIFEGGYTPQSYPGIFGIAIGKWENYIESVGENLAFGQRRKIKDVYPRFIALYKILALQTQIIITNEIAECVKNIMNRDDTSFINNTGTRVKFLDYLNVFKNLPIPGNIISDLLLLSSPSTRVNPEAWDATNDLIIWYRRFYGSIPYDIVREIVSVIVKPDDIINLHANVIINASRNINEVTNIVHNKEFRDHIRAYFGMVSIPDIRTPINALSMIKSVTNVASFPSYQSSLSRGEILPLFFLTETYSNLFILARQLLQQVNDVMALLSTIVSDIITFINDGNYYYIPQIFLPALIKQIIIAVNSLITIRSRLDSFNVERTSFMPFITIDENNTAIIALGDAFVAYVNLQLNAIYRNIREAVKYHNNIVTFLNYNSAYNLIRQNDNKLFSMNIIPVADFPNLLSEFSNYQALQRSLESYRIPQINYYSDKDPRLDVLTGATYRNIIRYSRTGKISNSPNTGDNLQVNYGAAGIVEVDANSGKWLNVSEVARDISYFDAFIGYKKRNIAFEWPSGMPASIRSLVSTHLFMMKQRIIENIVQYVVDNPLENILTGISEPADLTPELKSIRETVIIAKLTDSILNHHIEYTIRQSVSDWIYSIIGSMPAYRSLVSASNDYISLALQNMDEKVIERLENVYPIEPNPDNIPYSTGPTPEPEIHHLYNINYFSTGDVGPNKRCYKIDTDIVSRLITSENINAKNSDGNTALHYAVNIHHPEIVKILVDRGANPFSFKNNKGQSPRDMILEKLQMNIGYSLGDKVEDSINRFVVPYNDMLLAKLRDEKYANNIIRNITLGVPIQLIIYNHMFDLYLKNYQYGFSLEIKNNIQKLLGTSELYPMDLFEYDESSTILQSHNMNRTNERRTRKIREALNLIDTQINGLEKEVTTDEKQKEFINTIMKELRDKKQKLEVALVEIPRTDPDLLPLYQGTVASIRNIDKRYTSIIEFYNFAFKKFDSSLAIWESYMKKPLNKAPSMIFSRAEQALGRIMYTHEKNNLSTLVSFFETVKKYIELKNSLPNNTSDNPLLKAEIDQIIYLINIIITPAIKDIILTQVNKGLQDMGTNVSSDEIAKELKLDTYLSETLPRTIVKHYTGIYNSASDPDILITNADDLFLPLINSIKSTRIIVIDDNSTVIQNVRDHLIPFMINTYQNFINYLRLAIFGYEKYLLNTYQLSKILNFVYHLR